MALRPKSVVTMPASVCGRRIESEARVESSVHANISLFNVVVTKTCSTQLRTCMHLRTWHHSRYVHVRIAGSGEVHTQVGS